MEAVAPGRRLAGRYVLEELTATGGMAAVWRARDEILARKVAVKILREDLATDPGFAERFQREAVAAARLTHPNVISVFDTGEEDDVRYIVMEHFEGQSLRTLLGREAPLGPDRVVDLVRPVLSALAAAHSSGLIHRDVKPANILVGNGMVKVTDFGIAKAAFDTRELTTTGTLIGTARYLSPEQVQGGEIDGRSDLYSVGVVLFEMLTGRPPFEAATDLATAMMRLTREPPEPGSLRPGIPAGLERVVLRALARDPDQRFPTAEAMLAAVDRQAVARGAPRTRALPRVPPPAHPGDRASAFRSWMLVPLVVLALAAMVVVGGLALGRLRLGGPLGIEPAEETDPPTSPRPVAILGAQDFDPEGDGSEHPEEVSLAVDGARSTTWGTDHYNSADFGGLKSGLGLWVDLRGNPRVGEVTVVSPVEGWTFQVMAGTLPDDLSAPLSDADGSVSFEVRSGRAVVELEPVRAPGILIWITGLGPDDGRWAAAISEVRVMGAG
jgi:eukaryotic-like serine/threonine-protein kinase